MSDQQQMIALRDYSFTYAMGIKPALRHISLEIQEGDFIVLCGASGSGKSTLLEVLKPDITPCGASEGAIETALSPQEAAIVFQDPESQLLTASVLSDLALPMENCGLPPQIMRRRMAETVSFFGLEHLLHKGPELLSGGEKQLVSLCAALMMQPRLLLLDEPTAQLDPIAARAFFDMLRRVHEELGITVVLAEHRLDEAAALCSSLMLLQNGEIRYSGAPEKVFRRIWREQDAAFLPFVPQLPLCSLALDAEKPLALTPPALRERIRPLLPGGWKKEASGTEPSYGKPVLFFRDVCFAYEKGEPVLQNLRMELREWELLCLLGGNGSGKSTLLKLAAGILTPHAGWVQRRKGLRIGYLPQSLQACFLADTLAEALADSRRRGGCSVEVRHPPRNEAWWPPLSWRRYSAATLMISAVESSSGRPLLHFCFAARMCCCSMNPRKGLTQRRNLFWERCCTGCTCRFCLLHMISPSRQPLRTAAPCSLMARWQMLLSRADFFKEAGIIPL